MAEQFYNESIEQGYETWTQDGKTEVWDPETKLYGVYSESDGTPITYFEATNPNYWKH